MVQYSPSKTSAMKQILAVIIPVLFSFSEMAAQTQQAAFHGAPATLDEYKVLFILNQSDEKTIKGLLGNIKNALEDPRIKGKLQVELIAFSDGVELYKKSAGYESELQDLKNKGVLLAQCENTIRSRKISKDELWPFISYVPSAVGEIIIRQQEGWAAIHP